MRNSKAAALMLLFVAIAFLGACTRNVAGIYIHANSKREYLELRMDRTFFLRVHSRGTTGHYRVDGDVITLTLDGSGMATQAKIHDNVVTLDNDTETWVKGERAAVESGPDPAVATAANESEAIASMRTVNTAQVTYAAMYPAAGFARDLATLGPGNPAGCPSSGPNQAHACLINPTLGCADAWCVKQAYKYNLTAIPGSGAVATDYVILATPTSSTTGRRNFCSISDAVVRYRVGEPLSDAVNRQECQSWAPLG